MSGLITIAALLQHAAVHVRRRADCHRCPRRVGAHRCRIALGCVAARAAAAGNAARDALAAAVTEMLSRSMTVLFRAQSIGLQVQLCSGLSEGIDVTLGIRKPADAQELYD